MTHIPKHLQYKKPITFIDLETTGTLIEQDRIIEISILKLIPDREPDLKTYRIKPGIPIPPEATAIHGITDADVANKPSFQSIANNLKEFLQDCNLAGFNIQRFDIPLLQKEFERAGIPFPIEGRKIIDVQTIYHRKERRDLSTAYKYYCNKGHSEAHGAEADVKATLEILDSQLAKYDDLPQDVEGLSAYCNLKDPSWIDDEGKLIWRNGEAIFNFSKKRGKSLKEICETDPSFLQWILEKDFKPEFKNIISDALNGKLPSPQEQTEVND